MSADFDQVLAVLYEAAVVRDTWPIALQMLADRFGSRGALITRGDRQHQGLQHSPGLSATVAQFFEQGWHHHDYRTERCLPIANRGFITDQMIDPIDGEGASQYYDGFARPAGVPWFATGGIVNAQGVAIGISLQRSEAEGAFSDSEVQQLNRVHPRFAEVLSLAYRVNTERERSLLSGLELIDQPAVLLDWRGVVRDLNGAARALVQTLFCVSHGHLRAVADFQQAALDHWIGEICAPATWRFDIERRIVRLTDRLGLPWLGQAMPVSGAARDVFGTGDAILIFSPAHARGAPDAAMLALAYDLTAAESRVAALIAGGSSVDATAERLGLTRNAVRFHLKSILPKAGVERQAGFVAAASALAALAQRPPGEETH